MILKNFHPCYIVISGLRYVTEVQHHRKGATKYNCQLCGGNIKENLILVHLTGHQHKTSYIVSIHRGSYTPECHFSIQTGIHDQQLHINDLCFLIS